MKNFYTLYCFICIVAVAALAGTPVLAQNQAANRIPCFTDEHFAQQAAANPMLRKSQADLDAKIQQLTQNMESQRSVLAHKLIVPIVFHILYTASGAGGGVSVNDIKAAVATANRDFNRDNADTGSNGGVRFPGASMDLEFRLATVDPNGNCTNGVTRHETELSGGTPTRDDVKGVYSWPTDKYFNVWVVANIEGTISGAQGVIAGYAQFPQGQQGLSWNTWGVVVRSDVVNGGDRTLSHELGHCFNLYHTFQGGCGTTASNCASQGDLVCDTPPMMLSQNCNRTQNTCRTETPDRLDQIENFMSYDNCQNMFSPGQRTRVYAAIAAVSQLRTLTSDANAIAAGVQDGAPAPGVCPPVAGFFASRLVACGSTPVTFFNSSYNGASDPSIRYEWIIEGSDSGTYRKASPSVVFTVPGVHTVTLIAFNSAGRDTLIRRQYVGARPATGIGAIPLAENFDTPGFPNVNPQFYNNWEISSTSPSTNWEPINVGYTGSSIRVRNSGISGSFSRYLISPGLNLLPSTRLVLYFWRAHKRRANVATADKLVISSSTDCGSTWLALQTWSDDNTNPNLLLYTTTATQTALYVDPQPSEWKLDSVILNTRIPPNRRGNVRLRFESVNSNSNMLYIDDIVVAGSLATSVRSKLSTAIALGVMPNPGTTNAEINWATKGNAKATLELVDAAGRIIATRAINTASGSVPVSTLAPNVQKGLYLVRFRSDAGQQVTRFVLE